MRQFYYSSKRVSCSVSLCLSVSVSLSLSPLYLSPSLSSSQSLSVSLPVSVSLCLFSSSLSPFVSVSPCLCLCLSLPLSLSCCFGKRLSRFQRCSSGAASPNTQAPSHKVHPASRLCYPKGGEGVRSLVSHHLEVAFSGASSDSTYAGHHLLCPPLTTTSAMSCSQAVPERPCQRTDRHVRSFINPPPPSQPHVVFLAMEALISTATGQGRRQEL